MKFDAEMTAAELIESGSMHIDRRIRELVRLRLRIGHGFAYWICGDYYATKRGEHISLFHAPRGNSKPALSRLVIETRESPAIAYSTLAAALETDAGRRSAA